MSILHALKMKLLHWYLYGKNMKNVYYYFEPVCIKTIHETNRNFATNITQKWNIY